MDSLNESDWGECSSFIRDQVSRASDNGYYVCPFGFVGGQKEATAMLEYFRASAPPTTEELKTKSNKLVVKTEDTQRDETTLRKRSVLISGHQTSISIEDAFWIELKSICKQQTKSLNQIATEVDERRSGNLSSALRVFILNYKARDRLT